MLIMCHIRLTFKQSNDLVILSFDLSESGFAKYSKPVLPEDIRTFIVHSCNVMYPQGI